MKIKALLFLLLCGTSFVSAQRNEPSGLKKELVNESETFSITESFRLEAGYEMMMIPVVASIKVSETRQSFNKTLFRPNASANRRIKKRNHLRLL